MIIKNNFHSKIGVHRHKKVNGDGKISKPILKNILDPKIKIPQQNENLGSNIAKICDFGAWFRSWGQDQTPLEKYIKWIWRKSEIEKCENKNKF